MIMNDPVNRFDSNWGIYPTSISLVNDETTRIAATNIEMAGKDWSREGDFGDGLSGINQAMNGLGKLGEIDLNETLHSALDVSTLIMWPIIIYGVFAVVKAMTKSGPAIKRKGAISKARQDLREAKKLSRWHD